MELISEMLLYALAAFIISIVLSLIAALIASILPVLYLDSRSVVDIIKFE